MWQFSSLPLATEGSDGGALHESSFRFAVFEFCHFRVLPFFAEVWDALKAATEAETAFAQAIVDGAGIIVTSDDLSCCYDERGEEEGRVGKWMRIMVDRGIDRVREGG